MSQNQQIAWFVVQNGQQHGPLTDQDLQTRLARGILKPADAVWREGMPDWQLVQTVFPPRPASPPPVPPGLMAKAVPRPSSNAVPKSAPPRNVDGYEITEKTGTVQDIQNFTNISVNAYGGGIQNGIYSAPSTTVTSNTLQRIFVKSDSGGEWQFEAGQGFALRRGNRVKACYASANKKSELGFARNLDSGEAWYYPMKAILPGYAWMLLILAPLYFALPYTGIPYLLHSLTIELMVKPNSVPAVYSMAGLLADLILWLPIIGMSFLIVKMQRTAVRKKLHKAMAQ